MLRPSRFRSALQLRRAKDSQASRGVKDERLDIVAQNYCARISKVVGLDARHHLTRAVPDLALDWRAIRCLNHFHRELEAYGWRGHELLLRKGRLAAP